MEYSQFYRQTRRQPPLQGRHGRSRKQPCLSIPQSRLLLLACVFATVMTRVYSFVFFDSPRRVAFAIQTGSVSKQLHPRYAKYDKDDEAEDFIAPHPFHDDQDLPMTLAEVESLTIPQLKQQLRLRGLKVSGRKTELVERLISVVSVSSKPLEQDLVEPDVLSAKDMESIATSQARKFAEERGKELIDVTAYLDEDDKGKSVKSSAKPTKKDDEDVNEATDETSSGPEVWGSQARIVDDYEGRRIVVDNLSRTVVEFKGSNQTSVQAYVVASRDALKGFLEGGQRGQNQSSTTEEQLREIQLKREQAARVPVRFDENEGVDEGDETGNYENIIERDFTDWGKFTQTGAQLSASEIHGVLLLSDIYGALTDDTRALAEKIAFECQPVVVMVPDLFRGRPWVGDTTKPNAQGQTYEKWRATHSDLRVNIDIRAAAACLRQRYGVASIAVWGTCYGGGRALEAASGYFPNDIVHDVDGSVGPPPVDPMAAVVWYPTRYNAKDLFGKHHKGSAKNSQGKKHDVAVMAIFGGKDTLPGATPDDAAILKTLLTEDERVKDHMVKVFAGQGHGFAHVGLSASQGEDEDDDFARFVDEEFGGAGRVSMDGGDAEVACLLSTAWMETYSRVFLPTVGPAVSVDEGESEWATLEMKDLTEANSRDIREEIEEALDNFVEAPIEGRRMDRTDESQVEEMDRILREMQSKDEKGPFAIDPDDDLMTMYAKLKAQDENFQLF